MLNDDKVLIGGFIVIGNEPKEVVLRAIGPSLSSAGIPDPLADPVLELHAADGSTISTNDDWQEDPNSGEIPPNLQPTNALESALRTVLDPGLYTAIVKGKDGGTGVGLVEVYDLDETADSELANISTRGFVDVGNNVMIGGFILGGQGDNSTVLVRAIGPSLTQQGIDDALADPTLELRDINGAVVADNDNWQDAANSGDIPANLQPMDASESAVYAALPGGAYTAIVAGKNDTSGIGLVEVYNVP